MEALKRMTVKGVDLRPQFESFKAELVKMEEDAKIARDRATSMKAKGESAFAEWETEVQAINNPDIRKEAQKRFAKRKKSYDKIQNAMEEAREELVPFMSDLNDIRKLLDSELTEKSVGATKTTIRSADWHGEDVRDSLTDVEKELDRVAADLAKYQ
jgi:predicted  nucleic acid-binding Zn-ribbon protein